MILAILIIVSVLLAIAIASFFLLISIAVNVVKLIDAMAEFMDMQMYSNIRIEKPQKGFRLDPGSGLVDIDEAQKLKEMQQKWGTADSED
jgi:hypothetical protein